MVDSYLRCNQRYSFVAFKVPFVEPIAIDIGDVRYGKSVYIQSAVVDSAQMVFVLGYLDGNVHYGSVVGAKQRQYLGVV